MLTYYVYETRRPDGTTGKLSTLELRQMGLYFSIIAHNRFNLKIRHITNTVTYISPFYLLIYSTDYCIVITNQLNYDLIIILILTTLARMVRLKQAACSLVP